MQINPIQIMNTANVRTLKLVHKFTDVSGHPGKPCKCQNPSCGNCICHKRKGAKYCCDLCRYAAHNKINAIIYGEDSYRSRITRINNRVLMRLERLGIRRFDELQAKLVGFINDHQAALTTVDGKLVSVYPHFYVWINIDRTIEFIRNDQNHGIS